MPSFFWHFFLGNFSFLYFISFVSFLSFLYTFQPAIITFTHRLQLRPFSYAIIRIYILSFSCTLSLYILFLFSSYTIIPIVLFPFIITLFFPSSLFYFPAFTFSIFPSGFLPSILFISCYQPCFPSMLVNWMPILSCCSHSQFHDGSLQIPLSTPGYLVFAFGAHVALEAKEGLCETKDGHVRRIRDLQSASIIQTVVVGNTLSDCG